MPLEQIPGQQIRETLQRAQEIAQAEPARDDGRVDAFLNAAEEIGIPREATLQALRERPLIPPKPLTPGDLVFVPSEDQNLYVASVLSVEGAEVLVRFVSGGEHACSAGETQPLSLTPGRTVQYKYQGFGWITGQVSRCGPTSRTVWLTSIWDQQERAVPLSLIRLAPRRNSHEGARAIF